MDTEKNSPSKENLLILRGNGRKPKRNLLRKPPSSWTDLHAIDGVSTKVEYALGTNLRSTNQTAAAAAAADSFYGHLFS